MATAPLLHLVGVSKRFGGVAAVSDCSFAVAGSSITGLIGPNGAGKSTVFNLICGLERADRGSIVFGSVPIHRSAAFRIARLGLARTFQIPRDLASMTVLDNLKLVPRHQFGERFLALFTAGRRVRTEEMVIEEKACAVLRQVELDRQAEQPAGRLSGGQKKLLELARCLMTEPKLILLDEPTAGINPRLIDGLMGVLGKVHESGVTLLIIEHNMNVVMRLCHCVVVLDHGHVLCAGTPGQVRKDPRVLEAYLGGVQ